MRLNTYSLLLQLALLRWRLMQALTVLRQRRRLLLAGVLLGLAGALWLNWWLPDIWRSTSVYHLPPKEVLDRENNPPAPPGFY